MIVTIKAPSKSLRNAGIFEAQKLGVEVEPFIDDSFEITVLRQDKLDSILAKSNGTIISAVERMAW